ncbi:MAG: gluconolactonase [Hyphomicrobiaceae bacterium]|jgi:gluconolactonase
MAISDCGNITNCVACVADAGVERVRSVVFDDLTDADGEKTLLKCQRILGKQLSKLVGFRSKTLLKCWEAVANGKGTAPCPAPGDGRAAERITRVMDKVVKKACKICGGPDKSCDQTVGSISGSGGTDDITPVAIGFATQCVDLSSPGTAGDCVGTIDTFSDLLECSLCVGEFAGECMAAAAVPGLATYPQVCNGGEPEAPTGLIYSENFDGLDGAVWPAPWTPVGGVASYDLQGNRARFHPTTTNYSLARLYAPDSETDVEVLLTVEFSDIDTQGLGFYARSNGGYLDQTSPMGQGYAVFIEGFSTSSGIGVWREINGVEQSIVRNLDPSFNLQNGVRYRVRFRVFQEDASTTRLQARIWVEGQTEPTLWHADETDSTPVLQGLSGGFAVDAYSSINPGTPGSPVPADQFFDDVEIYRLADPLASMGPLVAIDESFSFLEGPRWQEDTGVLLFTDIAGNAIHQLTQPSTITTFRAPSNSANGLANAPDGDLIVAEHGSRSVTRTDATTGTTTIASTYLGMSLNSPNDVAVRSDGTIYFTDPPYGIAPEDQELPFNGVFRIAPAGTLIAEVEGGLATRPNGVLLSLDETTLFVSDTAAGTLTAHDVAVDGSLSGSRVISTVVPIADGMCIDSAGYLYVTTSTGVVVMFDDGTVRGTLPVPRQPSNCGFGGPAADTLYITAREGLYAAPSGIPGVF